MIYKYIHDRLSIWFKEKFNYDPKIQKAHWLIRQKDYIKNKKRDAALSLNPYGINNTKGGISNGKKE